MARLKPKEPLPEFANREEEAEFWDTHDLSDYWDEFKPVKVRFAKHLSEGITIRFDKETLARDLSTARRLKITDDRRDGADWAVRRRV